MLPSLLWQPNKTAIGYSIIALSRTAPHLIAALVQQVLRLMADGLLRIDIPEVLPLAQAAEAHHHMEARSHFGKLLLCVQEEHTL